MSDSRHLRHDEDVKRIKGGGGGESSFAPHFDHMLLNSHDHLPHDAQDWPGFMSHHPQVHSQGHMLPSYHSGPPMLDPTDLHHSDLYKKGYDHKGSDNEHDGIVGDEGIGMAGEGSAPPDDASPRILMSANIDLFRTAIGLKGDLVPGLCRPSFNEFATEPNGAIRFVTGTEDQNPSVNSPGNHLIFGTLSADYTNIKFSTAHPVPDHVRDLHWVDSDHLVFATGSKLGVARVSNRPDRVEEILMFPEFHKDVVREIAVSEITKNLVLSGGFDGSVFVTDISRLYSDMQKQERKSENSLYPCGSVVGSVRWHPTDAYLASCTTDLGVIHVFDIRTDRKRPAMVFDTERRELFTHDYRDPVTLLFGFGDGSLQVFDYRSRRALISFQDPYQKAVGDLQFNRATKHFAVFGVPEFTLWGFSDTEMRLWTHHQISAGMQFPPPLHHSMEPYHTQGVFLPHNAAAVAVTDSNGMMAVYSFGSL